MDENHFWSSCNKAGNGTAVMCCEIFESINLDYMHRSKPPKVAPLKDHTEATPDRKAAMGSAMWRYGVASADVSDPLNPAPGHVRGDVRGPIGSLQNPQMPTRATLVQQSSGDAVWELPEELPDDFLATKVSEVERRRRNKS